MQMPENQQFDHESTTEQHPDRPSHLFLVRMWPESDGEGDAVWCGKVQQVTHARANQFRDWAALVEILVAMLPDAARVRQYKVVEE
jgi:hypothetical protein